jgi:hypothetical protein
MAVHLRNISGLAPECKGATIDGTLIHRVLIQEPMEDRNQMNDYAVLIEEARSTGHYKAGTIPLTMTPALFGKLLVAAWAARMGRAQFPRRERMVAVLVEMAEHAPDEVAAVMHAGHRNAGDTIAEYDEYLAGALMDGLIARCGRNDVRVEIDRGTGERILAGILRDRTDLGEWIDRVVARLTTEIRSDLFR